ncbi:MAG: undecaprenyl-diphosphate phosphatase [Clostridia bacterium]|nr:undecaprenyl-diphosphate phosphatase [Clostridia bacterium]
MIIIEYLKVLLIAVVEGITEWLPVSSTGHMLLLEHFLPLHSMSPAFYSMFLYVIQFAAILAVIVYFFGRLNPFSRKKQPAEKKATWRMWLCVLVGVLPAAVIGLLLDDFVDEHIIQSNFGVYVVAAALIVYGIAYVVMERMRKSSSFRVASVDQLSIKDALLIGAFQCLSIIPGTSRSGSTILGGMALGVSRGVSAEFSFFMAIPIMAGVSLLKVAKYLLSAVEGVAGYTCTGDELGMLAFGAVIAFLVSLVCIRFLMDFVRRHSFEAFGWYRIVLGVFVLAFFGIFA